MSKIPTLPSVWQSLTDLIQRVGILEATAPPTSTLVVTDGSTTVDPTSTIDIGLGLVLTDLGSGEAEIALPEWVDYTPDLLASVTDPTIGSGGQTLGRYALLGNTVVVIMDISFGTGHDDGSGTYSVTLPFPCGTNALAPLGTAYCHRGGVGNEIQQVMPVSTGFSDALITFIYQDAWPAGALTNVDDSHPFGYLSGGGLHIEMIYETGGSE